MTDVFVRKIRVGATNVLVATSEDAQEAIDKLGNDPIRVQVKRIRNVDHHRKYFALLNLAYDYWEPFIAPYDIPSWAGDLQPQKNFDRFRKDIAILAGFYEITSRLNGELRVEAKSISFANMDQDEFEDLYDKTLNVILDKVFAGNWDEAKLRQAVEDVMAFS